MADTSRAYVHRLSARHWPVLRALRLAALRDTPRAFLGDPAEEQARTDAGWQALCRDGIWLVAEQDSESAGLVHLVRDPDSGDCYLESMWVAPDHRAQGIGRQILANAGRLALAHHRRAMFLWVLDGNEATRKFYLGLGFRRTGRVQPIGPHRERVEEEFRLDLTSTREGELMEREATSAIGRAVVR